MTWITVVRPFGRAVRVHLLLVISCALLVLFPLARFPDHVTITPKDIINAESSNQKGYPSEFNTHQRNWDEAFVPMDGMRFLVRSSCGAPLVIRSRSARGGRPRGVDGPAGEVVPPVSTHSLSTSECAMECFLRGRSKCAGFAVGFDPREAPVVLSTASQDETRRGICELIVDMRQECRHLQPASNSFPLPTAYLWRSDVSIAQQESLGEAAARGIHHRMAHSPAQLASMRSEVAFLVLSSPENLALRMGPALQTWLAGATRIVVFVESRSHSNTSVSRPDVGRALVDQFVESRHRERAALPADREEVYVELVEPENLRERHINGAWKPVALLRFLLAAHHLREPTLSKFFTSSWFVIADDDSYIIPQNLLIALLARTPPVEKECAMIGERFSFASGGKKVDYLQGGAGIVWSRDALFHPQIRAMFTHPPPSETCQPDRAHARLVKIAPSTGPAAGANVSWDALSLTTVCRGNHVVAEAGELWPAGDMRLAWIVHQAAIRSDGARQNGSSAECKLRVEHDARFWHRSVHLSLGIDRRNERSSFPISFHRVRSPHQMQELHQAVKHGLQQQKDAWPEFPGLVLRWSALENGFHRHFEADPEPFLEDDGWL